MRINHQLSCLCLVIFFLIGVASISANKIYWGFNTEPTYKRGESNNRNFIVKNDGTRIYGKNISWSYGVLSSHNITIDNEKYKITDIKGYQQDGVYYGRYHAEYLKRIVEGKLNVYYKRDVRTVTYASQSGHGVSSHQEIDYYYYAQRGDEGEMKRLANNDDIRQFVKDCAKSYEMIDKSDKEIRRSIKQDPDYLNEIFEIYNNDCK
jgi:hypothetical protein